MKIKGWELDFFQSGEWQVCDERLKDLEKVYRPIGLEGYNPGRTRLFNSLRATPENEVRVAIIGQDPYPDRNHATGLPFSVPDSIGVADWPPTLRNILNEYAKDLGRPLPSSGSLERWSQRGVLLWNTFPSCGTNQSLSHNWDEWTYLTREILRRLAKKGIVFAFLGQVARRNIDCIPDTSNHIVCTSHPSPRGSHIGRNPFIGSRLFSTINDKLNDLALPPIDWTLD